MDTYDEFIQLAVRQLNKGGALIMAGKEERNPMTIGWCQFGRLWNRAVCTIYVRPSRFSHELIERDGCLSVCFPLEDDMHSALSFCGTKSGRDVNKLEALGLQVNKSRAGCVDTLAGNFLHFECRVIGATEMTAGLTQLETSIREQFYDPEKEAGDKGDMHTVYYCDIVAAYTTEA